ncbi:hypothetical protein PFISCL1PPCAC_4305, partial [Pristionchus fissidentatus]
FYTVPDPPGSTRFFGERLHILFSMNNGHAKEEDFLIVPCCKWHVKRVTPVIAVLRTLLTTATCFAFLFREHTAQWAFTPITAKDQLILLLQVAIAATFMYGVYGKKKRAVLVYLYLEICSLLYITVFAVLEINHEESVSGLFGISFIAAALLTVTAAALYCWRIVFLYYRYLCNSQFFEHPPVIFVDKDELVPTNLTVKNRIGQ